MNIVHLIIMMVIFIIIDYYFNRSFFSPGIMFNLTYFVTLLLYSLKLSLIQRDLSEQTLLCMTIAVLGFNIVAWVFIFLKKVKLIIPKFKFKLKTNISKEKKFRIMNTIVIVIFLIEVIYCKGFPLYWLISGQGKTYADFGIPSLNGAFYGMLMCMGAYSLFQKNNKSKYLYLIIGLLVISRQVIMTIVIEGVIFWLLKNYKQITRKQITSLGIVLAVAVLFFGWYGNLRTGKERFNELFQAKTEYENLPSTYKWVYSYMTFSLSNFDNLVELTEGGKNHGAGMFREFMPTVIADALDIELEEDIYYLVHPNFTVSTYLPVIYMDFGMVGVGVFNMIISFVGNILYKKLKEKTSEKNRLYYAIYLHNILLLFFVNFFISLPVMVQFIYVKIIMSKDNENLTVIEGEQDFIE